MISLDAVGEAIAGYVLEDLALLHPAELNLRIICRPVHSAPDALMVYRTKPGRIALVETKASESQLAVELVKKAATDLIPVLLGWKNTGKAGDAVAVGVQVDADSTPDININVAVVKFIDEEGEPLHGSISAGAVAYNAT